MVQLYSGPRWKGEAFPDFPEWCTFLLHAFIIYQFSIKKNATWKSSKYLQLFVLYVFPSSYPRFHNIIQIYPYYPVKDVHQYWT